MFVHWLYCDSFYRIDLAEIKAHTELDVDSNGEVSDDEARVGVQVPSVPQTLNRFILIYVK